MRVFGLVSIVLLMGGCSAFLSEERAPESLRGACGRLCLQNGENCSQFFARKNEENRRVFEQAKSNYWMCIKRYQGEAASQSITCVPPGPSPEQYDHCGADLDACLENCGISLDELNKLAHEPSAVETEAE